MKTEKIMLILVFAIVIVLPNILHAQPGFTEEVMDTPVDGGLSLLLATGIGYGIKKSDKKIIKFNCKFFLLKIVLKVHITILLLISCIGIYANATNYTVSTKADLQNRMNAALPGDTVVVANGTYNFGQINITNTNSTASSNWIVLAAQTLGSVVFTGNTYLQFSGKRILVTGFKFTNGNTAATDVIQFRNSSGVFASYCRLNNIVIDNYNSDSTGSVAGISPDVDNKWVSIYGINNRVDHCTFINKANAGATVVVWYDNTSYPQQSTTTFHRIDSNYFKGRGYLGANGGETIRIGVSSTSRTNGYNIIEFNLFENCIQAEPEIISNKSNFNTYRYNTFKNCNGGLTLRHGRYCSVYNNFFIVDDATKTRSYGVRVIDKGHKIFNNYFEGLLGNKNSLTSLRCPIILYNGLSSTLDTIDGSKASGYFPADSSMVAFNTMVNCSGGAGVVLGFTDGGSNSYQPKGIVVANNLIKMSAGQAAYNDALNTSLTYTAEGNLFQTPNGVGLSSTFGFTSATLNFGTRVNGILNSPSLVLDNAINTNAYSSLLNGNDISGFTRSLVYDVGASELNGNSSIRYIPLDSTMVGAGKSLTALSNKLLAFWGNLTNNLVTVFWSVSTAINIKQFVIEYSKDGSFFEQVGVVYKNATLVNYSFEIPNSKNCFYRVKIITEDGFVEYSSVINLQQITKWNVTIYPNPTKNYFVLKTTLPTTFSNVKAQLYNAQGALVKAFSILKNEEKISVKELAQGIYYLQIQSSVLDTKILPIILQ